MDFAEIEIEQRFHKHIIGKGGSNISKIKDETGVAIRIPSDSENSNTIRIEGEPQGVKKAKKELLEMSSRMVSLICTVLIDKNSDLYPCHVIVYYTPVGDLEIYRSSLFKIFMHIKEGISGVFFS